MVFTPDYKLEVREVREVRLQMNGKNEQFINFFFCNYIQVHKAGVCIFYMLPVYTEGTCIS
jgi:hypothetical protein